MRHLDALSGDRGGCGRDPVVSVSDGEGILQTGEYVGCYYIINKSQEILNICS